VSEDQRAALEARIADEPDDPLAWSVYADYLQKQGDPHGELAALQHAADQDPVGKTKTPAQRAFARTFAKLAPRLLGTLIDHGADLKDPAKPPFVWKHGVLRRVQVGPPPDPTNPGAIWAPRAGMLAAVLAHPAARMLGELELRAAHDVDAANQLKLLIRHAPPQLRELTLFARADLGDLSELWAALPRLRRITIGARSFEVGELELPEARRVELMPLALSPRSMQAIAIAPWTELQRLEIRFGGQDLPPHASLREALPLLQRADLPKLTVLKLRGCPYAGALLRAVAEAPFAAQLVLLDVMDGNYNPHDLAHVAERKLAFASLRELWVQTSAITMTNVERALAGVAKHIVTRHVSDPLWAEMGAIDVALRNRYREPPEE